MRWISAPAFVLLAVLFVVGCTGSRPPAEQSSRELSRDPDSAEVAAHTAAGGAVNPIDTLLSALRSAYVDGRHQTVVDRVRAHRADSLRPSTLQSMNTLLGRARQAQGRHEAALSALRRARVHAFEAGKSVVDLDRALGESYAALHRWQQAASAFQRVLEAVPDDISARLAVAEVYRESRDWTRAREEYTQLVRADSSRGLWWARLAQCDLELNRRRAALNHFAHAHHHLPRSADVALSLSRLYRATKQPRAAREVVDTTLAYQAGDPRLWRRKGDLTFEQDDLQVAERAYRRARVTGDSSATVYRMLGFIEVKREQYAEALSPLRESYRKDPRPPRTTLYLGISYLKVDSLEKATKYLQSTIDGAAKPVADAFSQLGAVKNRQGEVEAAIRAYRTVLRIDPDRSEPYFRLATVYDEHYRTKTTAARHYSHFLEVSDSTQSRLRTYAEDRLRTLQPTLHMEGTRVDSGR